LIDWFTIYTSELLNYRDLHDFCIFTRRCPIHRPKVNAERASCSILIQELDKLQVHPALLSWISAFLFNRIGRLLKLEVSFPTGKLWREGYRNGLNSEKYFLWSWQIAYWLIGVFVQNSWMILQPSRLFLGTLSAP
jgi:hypothetical protein